MYVCNSCVVSKSEVVQTSKLGEANKLLPVRRPDDGGTSSEDTYRLRVNHFRVKFRPDSIIRHYNVDVTHKLPSKNGRPQRITKSDYSMIRESLFSSDPERLPLGKTAYDGEKNIFSAVELPEGTFDVDVSKGEGEKSISYVVRLTHVKMLEFCKLKKYLSNEISSIPRDILQGMDLVVKENPSRQTIPVGRHFYPMNPPSLHQDLKKGIIAIGGFQHSLKPTSQGLSLCLDYSVLSFRRPMAVLDYLHERMPRFNVKEFERFRRDVMCHLRGLKVNVTHRKSKQKYTITKLTDKYSRDLNFSIEGSPRPVRVLDYFKKKWGKDIKNEDIPCFDFGKGGRLNYVPMEFCVLIEGQKFPKEELDRNASWDLKNMSLVPPNERQDVIQKMVESDAGPCG